MFFIFSDFVLFKLVDDCKLVTIVKHHAYNTPEEINIEEPEKKDWAAVKVLSVELLDYIEIDESNNRVVFANKMVTHGDTYVYTYHIPSESLTNIFAW